MKNYKKIWKYSGQCDTCLRIFSDFLETPTTSKKNSNSFDIYKILPMYCGPNLWDPLKFLWLLLLVCTRLVA